MTPPPKLSLNFSTHQVPSSKGIATFHGVYQSLLSISNGFKFYYWCIYNYYVTMLGIANGFDIVLKDYNTISSIVFRLML